MEEYITGTGQRLMVHDKKDYELMCHYKKTLERIATNYDIDAMAEAKDTLANFLPNSNK